uniref:Sugar O-methyltransferase n=1 Tax=viral metagenome TaxID=1070528 RepID=A0A6C0AFH9_9ZZZZ
MEKLYLENIVFRINQIVDKYKSDGISPIWAHCTSQCNLQTFLKSDFEDMSTNNLMYGFYGPVPYKDSFNQLMLLAEALGASGMDNSETFELKSSFNIEKNSIDLILDKIEKNIGFTIKFPIFNGNCGGISSTRGFFSQRECIYLYVAKKILDICPDQKTKILEIGGGLGLLGYYLNNLGYKNYTSIDLPRSGAVQTYFFAKNLPNTELLLTDESENPFDSIHDDKIKILHYSNFELAKEDTFDIIINVDSLTEMTEQIALNYLNKNCSKLFLSINHEVNTHRVFDLKKDNLKLKYRYPFWPRKYYVEELYERTNL